MYEKSQLRHYQLKAINLIKEKNKFALFIDMGLGKTVTTLTAIKDLHLENKIKKTLIIAPLAICKNEWQKQASEWEHLKDIKFSLCIGNEKSRIEALKIKAEIYIINLEQIEWLLTKTNFTFDSLIIDECHTFKDPSTRRFKALKKVIHTLKTVILLTGTPSSNSLLNLWSQIYLLDQGQRLGRTFTQFKLKFFNQTGYNGYIWLPKEGAKEKITELIKDISISMDQKDYIELPDTIFVKKDVELNNLSIDIYKEAEKEFLISINQTEIDIPNSAALANKLLQICNGAIYDDKRNVYEIHKEKLKALRNIIDNNPNENFLVAYNYNSDRDRLVEEFKNEAIVFDGSKEQIQNWNDKKIRIYLCHPKSAGYGLNLQQGGNNIIWFGLSWSLQDYQQFNARLHRNGQNKPVTICHIVVKNTIDEKVLNAIKNKAVNQRQILEYLKFIN